MRKPPGDAENLNENQRCIIKMLEASYKRSIENGKKVYFIWIAHGWFEDPWKEWVRKMTESYFARYSEESKLVHCNANLCHKSVTELPLVINDFFINISFN